MSMFWPTVQRQAGRHYPQTYSYNANTHVCEQESLDAVLSYSGPSRAPIPCRHKTAVSASELAKHQCVSASVYVELCIVKTGPETAGQTRSPPPAPALTGSRFSRALSRRPGCRPGPGVSWRGCPDQEIMIVLHVVNIVGEHVKCLTD